MDPKVINIIEETVRDVLSKNVSAINSAPIGISNRHIHLSEKDVTRLFGKGYQLRKLKDLSQPGQYACQETLTLIGPRGKISNVRVLGPSRNDSQVEVSLSDGYILGIEPPIRNSGEINNTPPIILQGPKGQYKLHQGLICAARHIHMTPFDAKRFGVTDKEYVNVRIASDRPITFANTLVRVSPHYKLEMHIDRDEANAANIRRDTVGIIIR